MDFLNDVYKVSTVDFLFRFEAWSTMREVGAYPLTTRFLRRFIVTRAAANQNLYRTSSRNCEADAGRPPYVFTHPLTQVD